MLFMAGALCLARAFPTEAPCTVSLRLVDMATGRTLPGLVRITDLEHRAVRPAELLSRGCGLDTPADLSSPSHDWSVLTGPVTIRLQPGQYNLEAVAGLESELSRRSLDLTDAMKKTVEIPITRFSDVGARGWRSGNTHLHLARLSHPQADRYLEEIPRADGLDLVFVSYLERAGADQTYISNGYRIQDLDNLSKRSGTRFGNGEEHRHNFGTGGEGYGHVMFLNLRELVRPVSIGPGIAQTGTDGIPLRRGIDTARRQGARALWCHNEWGLERLPNLVTGRIDAQNVFDGSIRSGFEKCFYRDLNAGFRVPLSTGTDWFIYDFSRCYARLNGEPTVDNWLKALAEGRTFITNGPLLDLTVDGLTMGDVVRLERPSDVRIEGSAIGRVDFGQIELIRNGEVAATARCRPVRAHYEASISLQTTIRSPCWLALRIPPPAIDGSSSSKTLSLKNELGRTLFAHTSAIHIELAGRRYFEKNAAVVLLAEIRANCDAVTRDARFADDQERARVLDVYAEGVAALERHIAANAR